MNHAQEARRVLARRVLERRKAADDPLYLISHMSAPDERTADTFDFAHLRDETQERWGWQRGFLRWIHGVSRAVILKARQLGATWLCCAYVVWTALYRPGSLCLMYRQKHDDAVENVVRCWTLLNSLPRHLWNGAEVEIPQRGDPRGGQIELRFPDGSKSRIVAESSASAAGHGKTAAVIVLDEFSRIEAADEILKAVQPVAGVHGKILIPSTANGRSNLETGEGNRFHWTWENAEVEGYSKRFLPWSLHPDRDEHWYETSPEVRGLRSHERAEQYPADEHEAFTLTNRTFFDADDLREYAKRIAKPKRRFEFEKAGPDKARVLIRPSGLIQLFAEPKPDTKYAIGADVATGRGADYSAAYVIDLSSMELCAELHAKLDADLYAYQLHYLGRYFNTATIAVETGGGYGEAVIIPLRDGREGRPAYPRLYRHVLSSRPDLPISKPYGFPTNSKTRPLILSQFEKAVRERVLPLVSDALLWEMESFVYHDHGTSPRAQEGARDDLVMACAISLEMYRLYGEHAERRKPTKPKSQYKPWLRLGNAA